jgi:TadE-like protein
MTSALRPRPHDVPQPPSPVRVFAVPAAPVASDVLPQPAVSRPAAVRACGGSPGAAGPRPGRGAGGSPGAVLRWRAGPRERGVASLEYLGMLPFLLLIALAGIQLGIAAYCGEQAGTAARTAARTAAQHNPHPDAAQAGRDAVSDWVHPDIAFPEDSESTVRATATVHVPSVFPGVHLFDPVRRSATMPKEDATP